MTGSELGYFGNIWVRQNTIEKSGESFPGHKHKFDHVTLLVRGSIEVQVEGHPAKQFTAPTFVIIRKEFEHKVTSLTDDVIYYCVFALRNLDGEPIEDIAGVEVDPMSASPVPKDFWVTKDLAPLQAAAA
jgi:quercetin dioxygenase-like cupin family protein